ncbi:unnamed protein product [Rotaria sp. Silwood1]|nr:unnamed protein product [Rotaria sp. Silwood1]CAF1657324.1 unnamed protein product [Rotaria sp. Silwood1]CAF3875978.1 unnamed protein product [Rotaria sp. Silwood1]CAF3961983.1 unnamed protein product [Rotaria sp. Silwood1]CAF4903634.1 unnamed protein product [Rotaria sp. Silwood1]
MLSKQYSGLGTGALCRLDSEGLVKLQPIYAYMDGEKYKIANGYLKMVPDDSGTNRRAFMGKLAGYEVTVASYLESFIDRSKIKFDPSCNKPLIYTLTRENDITASTYFFSPYFKEIIESFTLKCLDAGVLNVIILFFVAKDAFLLEQQQLRSRASKKLKDQLGEPPVVNSKLRSGSHSKNKHTTG